MKPDAKFDGVSGARFIDDRKRSLTLLEIDERILIWFKKLDRCRMPSNYPTDHAMKLRHGDEELPHMPPEADVVIVGYALNHDQTKIHRVSLVHFTSNNTMDWFIDIESAVGTVAAMPPAADDGGTGSQTTATRIIVKRGALQTKISEAS